MKTMVRPMHGICKLKMRGEKVRYGEYQEESSTTYEERVVVNVKKETANRYGIKRLT